MKSVLTIIGQIVCLSLFAFAYHAFGNAAAAGFSLLIYPTINFVNPLICSYIASQIAIVSTNKSLKWISFLTALLLVVLCTRINSISWLHLSGYYHEFFDKYPPEAGTGESRALVPFFQDVANVISGLTFLISYFVQIRRKN